MAGRWHGEHQLPDIEVERNVHIIADIRYFVCVWAVSQRSFWEEKSLQVSYVRLDY